MNYENLDKQTNLHWYELNDGTKLRRYQLSDMILNLFANGEELTNQAVSEIVGLNETTTAHIIRSLCTRDLLVRRKTQRNTMYSKKISCALATMLYPKSMTDNFKIKDVKSHKMDQGKNISYPQSVNHQYGCVNTIYEGGE